MDDPRDSVATAEITPVQLILHSPHLVDAIMNYATRATLVSLLRVNKRFHEAAGKVLYHTVRIDKYNMAGFFLGAFRGTPFERREAIVCVDERGCLKTMEGCDRHSQLSAKKKAAGRKKKGPSTNFKAPLLLHVRVLSLGEHHSCTCRAYADHIDLLDNINTLRIVVRPVSAGQLGELCDDENECVLLEQLTPRKLVLRNLDSEALFAESWPCDDQRRRCLKEVVWVLPKHPKAYGDYEIQRTSDYFREARNVKIILNAAWEVWHPWSRKLVNRFEENTTMLDPYDILIPISSWTQFSDVKYTIYGLEQVKLRDGDDDFVEAFKRHFPDVKLDSDRLRQLVKDEVRTGALRWSIRWHEYNEEHAMDNVEFKTLEEYAALPESERLYELDDGL